MNQLNWGERKISPVGYSSCLDCKLRASLLPPLSLQHSEQYLTCGHYSVGNTWGVDRRNEEGSPQETKIPKLWSEIICRSWKANQRFWKHLYVEIFYLYFNETRGSDWLFRFSDLQVDFFINIQMKYHNTYTWSTGLKQFPRLPQRCTKGGT